MVEVKLQSTYSMKHEEMEISLAEFVKRKCGHISMGIMWEETLSNSRKLDIVYSYLNYDKSKDLAHRDLSRKQFNALKEHVLSMSIEDRRNFIATSANLRFHVSTVKEREFDKFTRGAYRSFFASRKLGIV